MDSTRRAVRIARVDTSGGERRDRRETPAIGRHARLELAFETRRGRTVLAHAYAEPPFRVGRTFEMDDAAYVIVVCSGPGVFAGDTLQQSVHVAPGARAVLTSQSALQVHPSAAARPAHIRHEYQLDEDAELHCHWDPMIPFADARVVQQFDVRLAATSRLYWSDALMAGRVTRGEVWRFTELAHELTLRVGDVGPRGVRYLERYRLRPVARDLTRAWIAGRANYLATTLLRSPRATADAAETFQRHLDALPGAQAGVDMVEPNLIVARLAAASGPVFTNARAALRRLALDAIFDSPGLLGRK